MKYIKLFEDEGSYNNYINNDPVLPNVSFVEDEKEVLYNQKPPIKFGEFKLGLVNSFGDPKKFIIGMTWEEWINSDYNNYRHNTDGSKVYVINNEGYICYRHLDGDMWSVYKHSTGQDVKASDLIEDGELYQSGSSGSND